MYDAWDKIIDDCGGTGAVAEALGATPSTVSGWRDRGIPSTRWLGIVRLAAGLGKNGITVEVLAVLDSGPKNENSAIEQAGA